MRERGRERVRKERGCAQEKKRKEKKKN